MTRYERDRLEAQVRLCIKDLFTGPFGTLIHPGECDECGANMDPAKSWVEQVRGEFTDDLLQAVFGALDQFEAERETEKTLARQRDAKRRAIKEGVAFYIERDA